MAGPCTAAIVGMGSSYKRHEQPRDPLCIAAMLGADSCPASPATPRDPDLNKTRLPLRSRSAHSIRVAAVSSIALINSICISGVIALRRSGRFSVMVRIGVVVRYQNRLVAQIPLPFSEERVFLLDSRTEAARNLSACPYQRVQGLQSAARFAPHRRNSAIRVSVGILPTRTSCANGHPPRPPIAASNRLHPAWNAARIRSAASAGRACRCTPISRFRRIARSPRKNFFNLIRAGETDRICKRNLPSLRTRQSRSQACSTSSMLHASP